MSITELTDDAPVGATIESVTRRRTPVRIPAERYTSQSWADLEQAEVWPKVRQLAAASITSRLDAPTVDDHLQPVPDDIAWAGIDDFRCTHREMLPMCDDVNSPQEIWEHHGRIVQPYGRPSPRLRGNIDDQTVWDAFVDVMGGMIGINDKVDAGEVPEGQTLRDVIAQRGRASPTSRSPVRSVASSTCTATSSDPPARPA